MHRLLLLLAILCPLLSAQFGSAGTSQMREVLSRTRWVNRPTAPLPAGVSHRTFYSKALKQDVGYLVYLPPDYERAPQKRYPVIYNLHGAGGNELHGLTEAKVLDEGIRSGKWPAMIMVMPNGGTNTFYKDSFDGKWPAETLIIREFLPHVDQTYRTVTSRAGRAIEGFSMGGRGATRLAIKYPNLFCSLFNQAGNVPHLLDAFNPAKPDQYPMFYLGLDRARYLENDVYHLITKNLPALKGKLRIQIFCGAADEGHLPTVRDFHAALVAARVDHTYLEIEGLAHKREEMIARYRSIWFDYHVESFRRSGALPQE